MRGAKQLPRKIKDRLTLKEATLIEAHRLDLPGVMVQVESRRNYLGGVAASHVLGYVGEVSAEQLDKPEFAELHQGSIVGQYGVEKFFDQNVRGMAGQKNIEVDALGHEKRTVLVDQPHAGDDLYLTIDARLQKVAEDLLGQESGAIVALDPTKGDILAMASRPAFDPNVLSRELTPKQWVEIVQDEGRPLNNRASQGQYPPGSTFKVMMAAAALESKTVTPASTVFCNGGISSVGGSITTGKRQDTARSTYGKPSSIRATSTFTLSGSAWASIPWLRLPISSVWEKRPVSSCRPNALASYPRRNGSKR